jgi:hypothetical protein
MTTMTPQDGRAAQDERDDVRGHLFWVIIGLGALGTVTASATVITIGTYIERSGRQDGPTCPVE